MRRRSVLLKDERVCSPALTPCDFLLWGFVKENVFVPTLPLDIDELKLTVTTAIDTIDKNMLGRVWDELDGIQTKNLSGHECSSHLAHLRYVKLSEFVIQMARVTTVNTYLGITN
jgi:hypothetical protein